MFNVYFLDASSDICRVAAFPTVEDAISFSLALHRSSNVSHRVKVINGNGSEILVLSFDSPAK